MEFSSVGSRKTNLAPVDCNEVLQIALAALRASIEQSNAVVSYDSLPWLVADEVQLVQLFQNLISNGIKYQNGGSAKIHVSCKPDGARWIFSVKDNGIGIDPKYADRIFFNLPALAYAAGVLGHGHRTVALQENRRAPRWQDLGEKRARRRL